MLQAQRCYKRSVATCAGLPHAQRCHMRRVATCAGLPHAQGCHISRVATCAGLPPGDAYRMVMDGLSYGNLGHRLFRRRNENKDKQEIFYTVELVYIYIYDIILSKPIY